MRAKLWVILGAADGLGYAAVKYLVSHGQIVIALTNGNRAGEILPEQEPLHVIGTPLSDIEAVIEGVEDLTIKYGLIDYIVNNADYHLFAEPGYIEGAVNGSTVTLIRSLLPFLQKAPKGSLINLPPQLCLAAVPDKGQARDLSHAMETFLHNLNFELTALDCRLVFLRPGMRFPDLLTDSAEN